MMPEAQGRGSLVINAFCKCDDWYLGLLQHRGNTLLRRIVRSRRSKSLPNKKQGKQAHATSHHGVGFWQAELQIFPRCKASSVSST